MTHTHLLVVLAAGLVLLASCSSTATVECTSNERCAPGLSCVGGLCVRADGGELPDADASDEPDVDTSDEPDADTSDEPGADTSDVPDVDTSEEPDVDPSDVLDSDVTRTDTDDADTNEVDVPDAEVGVGCTPACVGDQVCDEVTVTCRAPLTCDALCAPRQLCTEAVFATDAVCQPECEEPWSYDEADEQCILDSLNDGLIARWDFDGVSGGSVPDLSGNGHDGVFLEGSLTTVDPCGGTAALFDGTNRIRVPYDPSFNLNGSVTMSMWIRVDRFNGLHTLLSHPLDVATSGYKLGVRSGAEWPGNLLFASGDAAAIYSVSSFAEGEWLHVAVVDRAEDDTQTIYLGGVEDSSRPVSRGTRTASSQPLYLGSEWDYDVVVPDSDPSIDRPFFGAVDDVWFFDRALSTEEIGAIYAERASCLD